MSKVRKILFVCEGNLHRSPTAEWLYSKTPNIRVRSAGLSNSARVQVTDELISGANFIFVMEKRLLKLLQRRFAEILVNKELICLGIEDNYQYQQPELITLLTERLTPYLGQPLQ